MVDWNKLATPIEISDEQLGEAIFDKNVEDPESPPAHQSSAQRLLPVGHDLLQGDPASAPVGIPRAARKDWFAAQKNRGMIWPKVAARQ
jgi:hypothetical protein